MSNPKLANQKCHQLSIISELLSDAIFPSTDTIHKDEKAAFGRSHCPVHTRRRLGQCKSKWSKSRWNYSFEVMILKPVFNQFEKNLPKFITTIDEWLEAVAVLPNALPCHSESQCHYVYQQSRHLHHGPRPPNRQVHHRYHQKFYQQTEDGQEITLWMVETMNFLIKEAFG